MIIQTLLVLNQKTRFVTFNNCCTFYNFIIIFYQDVVIQRGDEIRLRIIGLKINATETVRFLVIN
jgi:hypothetical protein